MEALETGNRFALLQCFVLCILQSAAKYRVQNVPSLALVQKPFYVPQTFSAKALSPFAAWRLSGFLSGLSILLQAAAT